MPSAPSVAAESREIRVFIPSTFRDFMEERERGDRRAGIGDHDCNPCSRVSGSGCQSRHKHPRALNRAGRAQMSEATWPPLLSALLI
jgi:hypothetical protein